jgi:hypothetical protein
MALNYGKYEVKDLLTAVNSRLAKKPFSSVSFPNLSITLTWGFSILSSRENISAAYFAGAILLALRSPSIVSLGMVLYGLCIFLGFYYAPRRISFPLPAILSLVIVASAFIAILISLFIEDRNTPATAFLAMATALLFPLIWATNIERIFYALIPGWFLQASVMTWQWFAEGASRTGGIAENENAGSAFLLLGMIFLATHKRLKWLAIPLLIAMPFSGSRWVIIVAVIIFVLIFLSKRVNWKYLLPGMALSFVVLFGFQHAQLSEAYRVSYSVNKINSSVKSDIQYRANSSEADFNIIAIWIPRGFHDTNLHSLPLRMADETGLLSAMAWLAVGGLTLYYRPRYSWAWWSMATIMLLSVMYYHVWIGPMGVFWWLLVAALTGAGVPEAKERPLESNPRG